MVPELVRSAVVSRRRIAGGLLEWTCRAIPCTGGATMQATADGRYTLGLHPRGLTRGDRLTRGLMRVLLELSSYWGIKNSGRPHPRGHRAGSPRRRVQGVAAAGAYRRTVSTRRDQTRRVPTHGIDSWVQPHPRGKNTRVTRPWDSKRVFASRITRSFLPTVA